MRKNKAAKATFRPTWSNRLKFRPHVRALKGALENPNTPKTTSQRILPDIVFKNSETCERKPKVLRSKLYSARVLDRYDIETCFKNTNDCERKFVTHDISTSNSVLVKLRNNFTYVLNYENLDKRAWNYSLIWLVTIHYHAYLVYLDISGIFLIDCTSSAMAWKWNERLTYQRGRAEAVWD